MKESDFQSNLIKELKQLFPDSIVFKLETKSIQGLPDLIILWKNKWAALEVKRSKDAHIQPNQPFYVDLLNKMSFSRFIYPENKEEVLDDLQQAFRSRRTTRVPKSK